MTSWTRSSSRFTVSQVSELKVYVAGRKEPYPLVSLSAGGCGIYLMEPDARLEPSGTSEKRKITFQFEFEGIIKGRETIQGLALYRREIDLQGKIVYYYGFEFLENDRAKIQPIVDEIERMELMGVVSQH